jgi:hypothetical protein
MPVIEACKSPLYSAIGLKPARGEFYLPCYEKFLEAYVGHPPSGVPAQAGKPVLLKLSFLFFQQDFTLNLLI